MIVFDLACAGGHVFEAWFGSSTDYAEQRASGLLACPLCGITDVDKAVMAPSIPAKSNQLTVTAPAPPRTASEVTMRGGPPLPAEAKAMLAALARAQRKLLASSEHVGHRFASEARAMHDGDAPERPIHGQATLEEARGLIEDGVPVAPLPLPVVPDEKLH